MTSLTSQTKVLHFTITAIAMTLCFEAFAAPPPPGIPKKNDCQKNLVAVNVFDIEFGNFDGTTAGTITVTPSGARSTTGPVLIGGTVRPAAFDVSNSLANCDYWPVRIQAQGVPTDLTGPGTAMPSDVYTYSPATPFTLSATPGIPTRVSVGASLTTGAAQASGSYTTAAPFNMRFSHVKP